MVKISQALQTPVGSIQGGVPLSRVNTNPDDNDGDDLLFPKISVIIAWQPNTTSTREQGTVSWVERKGAPFLPTQLAPTGPGSLRMIVPRILDCFQSPIFP